MSPDDRKNIESFFSTIDPWVKAYTHVGLSYFAERQGSDAFLLQARLFLSTSPSKISRLKVETESIFAGHCCLADFGLTPRNFVERLILEGEIDTPHGKLRFPQEGGNNIRTSFDPFHRQGTDSGSRLSVLLLSGQSKNDVTKVRQPQIDWELKASDHPFDSLDELLLLLVLGGSRNDAANIEIVAYHVAEINFKSVIKDVEARPSVFLAKSLDPKKCKISYRVIQHGTVVERGAIQGAEMDWSEQESFIQGEGWVGIPQGAVLHCVASYNGYAQHQGWVADPAHSQNARRVSQEAFDERLEILRDFLFEEQKPRKNSQHDFELGVSWLIWMLGFSVSHTGGSQRTSDAPDILATTPQGNILVVECTIGILKAENKLANLVDRTEVIRKRLASSGNSHLKLLPIIVSAKTKEEVKADLDQAQKLGIFVVTQESLLTLMQQTIASPDPEVIFNNALDSVRPDPIWLT